MNNIGIEEFKESDLYLVSRWRRDPRINMYIRHGRRTLDEVQRWYRDYFSGETNKLFLISYNGNSLGYFTIEGIDHINRKCEFGIVIGEVDFHNKGIGLSVIKMMLEKAFDDMGMHRILAVINEDNAASIRCFSKAGFTLEGRHREAIITNNEYKDLLHFSIVEHEWRSRKRIALK
jgi:RimJ/RimL family protein N-acetyltransferase